MFEEMTKIREETLKICKKAKCERIENCKKKHTLCSESNPGSMRDLISKNGGLFLKYFYIRNRLVKENLPLVKYVIRGIGCNTTTIDDIRQEGNIGLIKAVEKFDPKRNRKFSTFAYMHIKRNVIKYIKTNNLIRKKGWGHELLKSIERVFDRMCQDNKEITNASVLKNLREQRVKKHMPERKLIEETIRPVVEKLYIEYYFPYQEYKSIDKSIEMHQSDDFYDLLSDRLDDDLLSVDILTAEIVKMRFGLGSYINPMSRGEIAVHLKIHEKAVKRTLDNFLMSI